MGIREISTRRIVRVVFAGAIVSSMLIAFIYSLLFTSGNAAEMDRQSNVYIEVFDSETNLTLINSIRPYEPTPRPPLDQIVVEWNITTSPQWLLNFAIVGFPKCGTSSMMHYFNTNTEVQIFKNEKCHLGGNQQVTLIKELYTTFPSGDFVKGIKCPSDVEAPLALKNYGKFFPKTDFIVGIRHPVKWLESFYNHRVHNQFPIQPLQKTLFGCMKGMFHVCTKRAEFHWYLSNLGKTNLSQEERMLFGPQKMHQKDRPKHGWKGRVFLYDVDQLDDQDEVRAHRFRRDLQSFLYLRKKLPPMVWFKPGRKTHSEATLEKVNNKKVDICEDQYKQVRESLLEIATNVSKWVRGYFLKSPDVVVSNREHFEAILLQWQIDPCADGGSYKTDLGRLNCTKLGCFKIK